MKKMGRSRGERREFTHKWKLYVTKTWGPQSIVMVNYRSVGDYPGKRNKKQRPQQSADVRDIIRDSLNDSI